MISKYSHKELAWIDLEAPKDAEISYVLEEYNIPSIIKEEMSANKNDDVIRLYNDYIYAFLSFPQVAESENVDNKLIFIASDKYIFSIHNEPIQALSAFLKEMELGTMDENNASISDNKLLFAHLLKSLYVNSHKQIIAHDAKIKNLREQIIKNNKRLKSLTIWAVVTIIVIIILYVFTNI